MKIKILQRDIDKAKADTPPGVNPLGFGRT